MPDDDEENHIVDKSAAALSLEDNNKKIRDNEGSVGAVVKIGNDGTATLITYNSDDTTTTGTKIVKAADVPANATQVSKGKIFVSGTLMDCVAIR